MQLFTSIIKYFSGGSGSEEENDTAEKEDKSQASKKVVEVSDDDNDDEDEDEDDDDDDDDVQTEVTAGATLTVGDLIQAMKTKKKIPVSQPSSVVSGVFHSILWHVL